MSVSFGRPVLAASLLLISCLGCSLVAGGRLERTPAASTGSGGTAGSTGGVWHLVERGQTLWRIGREYGVSPDEIARVNGISDPARLPSGTYIWIPGASRALYVEPAPLGLRAGGICWPAQGRITSRFGMRRHPVSGRRVMHHGIDIAVPEGTPVRAAERGRVTFAGDGGGYGNLLVIDHGGGWETRYGHNSLLLVREGEFVGKGQVVARAGSTGVSTGPHVHFEVRVGGRPVDPLQYLP